MSDCEEDVGEVGVLTVGGWELYSDIFYLSIYLLLWHGYLTNYDLYQ